jgi:hypothetical protein
MDIKTPLDPGLLGPGVGHLQISTRRCPTDIRVLLVYSLLEEIKTELVLSVMANG